MAEHKSPPEKHRINYSKTGGPYNSILEKRRAIRQILAKKIAIFGNDYQNIDISVSISPPHRVQHRLDGELRQGQLPRVPGQGLQVVGIGIPEDGQSPKLWVELGEGRQVAVPGDFRGGEARLCRDGAQGGDDAEGIPVHMGGEGHAAVLGGKPTTWSTPTKEDTSSRFSSSPTGPSSPSRRRCSPKISGRFLTWGIFS